MRIETPEGVDLELALAGLGSRFVAALLDALIRLVLLGALALLLVGASAFADAPLGGGYGVAVFLVAAFLLVFGYDILFEVLASGRTPGKRWSGIRVVLVDGRPVGFVASTVRNLVRIVDFLPSSYVIGSAAILATRRNQRLGDLAAGTVVVRERTGAERRGGWSSAHFAPAETAPAWDVSAVTPEEIAAVRRFLDRRGDLVPEARARLGWELAERLRPKVAGAPDTLRGEPFLEQLAAAKASRG